MDKNKDKQKGQPAAEQCGDKIPAHVWGDECVCKEPSGHGGDHDNHDGTTWGNIPPAAEPAPGPEQVRELVEAARRATTGTFNALKRDHLRAALQPFQQESE